MIRIRYDALDGVAVRDGDVNQFVDDINWGLEQNIEISVSTENVINEVRARIKEGMIPYINVVFLFDQKILLVDKNGRLDWWPNGFCDTIEKQLMRLL
jgi:hypothetical protein